MMRLMVGLLLLLASVAEAQTTPFPLNAQQASGVNAAQSIILTPRQATQAVRLYDFLATCSAGSASLSILDGATTVRSYSGIVTTNVYVWTFLTPMIATQGHTMTVSVTSCGGGNTSTLSVRADSF